MKIFIAFILQISAAVLGSLIPKLGSRIVRRGKYLTSIEQEKHGRRQTLVYANPSGEVLQTDHPNRGYKGIGKDRTVLYVKSESEHYSHWWHVENPYDRASCEILEEDSAGYGSRLIMTIAEEHHSIVGEDLKLLNRRVD